MTLIANLEGDDEALAKLEDEAILAAANVQPEPDIPLGDDLAQLIERLTSGNADPQAA
jgi:hypothetical protein